MESDTPPNLCFVIFKILYWTTSIENVTLILDFCSKAITFLVSSQNPNPTISRLRRMILGTYHLLGKNGEGDGWCFGAFIVVLPILNTKLNFKIVVNLTSSVTNIVCKGGLDLNNKSLYGIL